MAAIFVACGDSLRGSAGQRSMRESNRCDGVQCAHQFFRKRSPTPRRTYTQLFLSLLLSLSSIFTRTRFFLQKSLLLLFVISVIVVGVFDHSAVQTAVVVVF